MPAYALAVTLLCRAILTFNKLRTKNYPEVTLGRLRLIKEGGIQALKRQVNEDHIHANRTDRQTTDAIIEFSLDNPHLGQAQVSNHLMKNNRIEISASGVRDVWLSKTLQAMALRLQKKSKLQS